MIEMTCVGGNKIRPFICFLSAGRTDTPILYTHLGFSVQDREQPSIPPWNNAYLDETRYVGGFVRCRQGAVLNICGCTTLFIVHIHVSLRCTPKVSRLFAHLFVILLGPFLISRTRRLLRLPSAHSGRNMVWSTRFVSAVFYHTNCVYSIYFCISKFTYYFFCTFCTFFTLK